MILVKSDCPNLSNSQIQLLSFVVAEADSGPTGLAWEGAQAAVPIIMIVNLWLAE